MRGRQNAGEQFEQRTFARSVGADDADTITGVDGQGKIAQGPKIVAGSAWAAQEADEEVLKRAPAVELFGKASPHMTHLNQGFARGKAVNALNAHTSSPKRSL